MLFQGDRKKGIEAMAVVSLAAVAILCGAVFCFHLIVQQNRLSSSGEKAAANTKDWGESTEKISTESKRIEGEEIFLIKGDIHRSNRYEKVDRLSYTSTAFYTEEDLRLLDSDGLRVTRNEIYARHGRMFNDQTLQDYFNDQDWYRPQYAPDHFDESILNDVEAYNMDLIHSYEINNGMNAEAAR